MTSESVALDSQGSRSTSQESLAETTAPGIRLRSIRKEFGPVVAVDHLDLDIADGEFFAVLGPSGSGKTTVLRMIAGFEIPTAGTVQLGGQDATRQPPFRRNVNTVFQDYALFPHMSVAQNVEYGLKVKRVPKSERGRRVGEALDLVRLGDLGARKPSQLSGGQRQRIALARALVNRPRVLLLDEPLGALDLKLREQMQVELKAIQREVGITFVFVTHDQEEALTLCDRLAVMRAGRIEQVGTAAEVYETPTTRFVAEFVGTSNVFSGANARAILGRDATFVVRPEKIRVGGPDPDDVSADLTVREVVYAGSLTRLVGDGPADGPMSITVPNSDVHVPRFDRGASLTVSWPRAACRELDVRSEMEESV